MKYNMAARVYNIVFSKLFKAYTKVHDPNANISKIMRDIKREYRAMIERTPSLDKGDILAPNLIGACYFFAIAKVVPDMTPERMDDFVAYAMSSELMRKVHEKKKRKGTIFTDKYQDKWVIAATKSRHSHNEMGWKYTYEKGTNEIRYTYTKCGVCTLAKREGVMEYLPCMCKMDYPKYELVGATLYRQHTLAAGDECCDFNIVRTYRRGN